MIEEWEKLDSQTLADYHIFTVRQDTRRSPRTGQVHDFFVLDSPDWVNVIPITPAGNVVFIHQFRHGTAEVILEIPGGIVDPQDESPAETARRELLEETGYEADDYVHIGRVVPNPAFLNNRLDTFLALGARRVQKPDFEGSEDIEVDEIALTAVPHLIASGRITHALVVSAFYHYEHYVNNNR